MPFNVGGKIWNGAMAKGQALISDPTSTVVTRGLVCHLDAANISSYYGDGTTWYDLSGNGNNATLYNTPTWTGGASGYFDFDGSNEYARITRTDALDAMHRVTLVSWFMADGVSGEGNIISKEYQFRLMSSHGSSNPGMQIEYTSSGNSYSGIYVGSALTASIWYMMAGTYDKDSGHQKLYLNNVLKSSATLTAGTVLYDNNENIKKKNLINKVGTKLANLIFFLKKENNTIPK